MFKESEKTNTKDRIKDHINKGKLSFQNFRPSEKRSVLSIFYKHPMNKNDEEKRRRKKNENRREIKKKQKSIKNEKSKRGQAEIKEKMPAIKRKKDIKRNNKRI